MKNSVLRRVFACYLLVLSLSFLMTTAVFAELPDEARSVNAVESADETITDDGEIDGESEFISEAEALNQAASNEEGTPANPDTGEFFKFMPAVIALVVLIAMLVIKKLRNKKKK